MIKINYVQFLNEGFDPPSKFVGSKREVQAGKAALARSDIGVTVMSHDPQVHYQFTYQGPDQVGIQRWRANPHTRALAGLIGQTQSLPLKDALKTLGNSIHPDELGLVHNFFTQHYRSGYSEYLRNLDPPESGS